MQEDDVSPLPDLPGYDSGFEEQLCETLRTWGFEAAVHYPGMWSCLADLDPTQLHHPYGWLPPSRECWAGSNTVLCCPKIIEHQTSWIQAEKRADYLVALAVSADLHVRFQSLPPAERNAAVDSELYDLFPEVLRALTDVSMAALDDRLASPRAADPPGPPW